MRFEALDLLSYATELLAEVRAQDPAKTPRSIAHAAYYSMFHAARALLLEARGTVSMKHGSVLNAFDALMRDETDEVRRFSKLLRGAYDTRISSDYTGDEVSPAKATELVALATDFVAYCARRLGAKPPPTADP